MTIETTMDELDHRVELLCKTKEQLVQIIIDLENINKELASFMEGNEL
jgi:hypothetical protein